MIANVPKSVNQAKNCWGVTAGQQGLAAALPSPDSEAAVDPKIGRQIWVLFECVGLMGLAQFKFNPKMI